MNILVIGTGIAGPSLCYWLKKFGFAPTLIEKSASLREGGQALDIRGVAVELVQKMGIYDALASRRTQVQVARSVDRAGHVLHEEQGEKSGFRQGDELELLRGDLVDVLMQQIPDVPRFFGTSVLQMVQHKEFVAVTFQDGKEQHFDLVIGADGIHSATRKQAFGPDEYKLHFLGAYLSTFSVPNYLHLHHTEVTCEHDEKQLGITSDRKPEKATVGFLFRSAAMLEDGRKEAKQKQFLRDSYANFGWEADRLLSLMGESPDFYFDAIMQVQMPSWTKGRVALLGDAGYCASPLSGQGNNLAMVGAYILAGELKQSHGNHVEAFKRYNSLMRPFVEKNQEFGAWVAKTYLTDTGLSEQQLKDRLEMILEAIAKVSCGITLPEY